MSRASSQLQFAKITPFHTPIELPASRVCFRETTMPSRGEMFRKAAENVQNQRILTKLSSLNLNFIDYLVCATNQGSGGGTALAFQPLRNPQMSLDDETDRSLRG